MTTAPTTQGLMIPTASTTETVTGAKFGGFAVSSDLYFGFFRKFVRSTGSNTDNLAASIKWYNSSDGLITTTTQNLSANGTTAWDFMEYKVTAPSTAVRAQVVFVMTPGGGTSQHNIYITSVRVAPSELSSTDGADWDTNLANIPPNLAILVGDEVINNQAILDEISVDGVWSVQEKIGSLNSLIVNLEGRYTDLVARATALGLSTTALSTARVNWQTMLNAYSPSYADTDNPTTIYASLFTGIWPTDWTVSNVSNSASNAYRTINDSGASLGYISEVTTQPSGVKNYVFGVIVEKSSNTGIKRIELVCTGGSAKTGGFNFRLSDGATGGASNATIGGVEDLGTEWFVWGTFTTNTGNTSVEFKIYPAFNATLTSSTSAAGTTGSVNVRSPMWALGSAVTALGRAWMNAKLYAYGKEMTALAQSISALDAATSVVINPHSDTYIAATSAGAIKTGELPLDVAFKASTGSADVTASGTWSVSSATGLTATIGAGTGILNITALTIIQAVITVTFVYAGVTRTMQHTINRQDDPASSSGGGGSTGSSTTTLANTVGTSYDTTNAASDVITCAAGPLGNVVLAAPISYKRVGTNVGATGAAGKFQWRVPAGTWADVQTETVDNVNYAEYIGAGGGEPAHSYPGSITVNQTKGSLTPGNNYEFKFVWRDVAVSGTAGRIYKTNGTITASGT